MTALQWLCATGLPRPRSHIASAGEVSSGKLLLGNFHPVGASPVCFKWKVMLKGRPERQGASSAADCPINSVEFIQLG
jgi:hypothetical protein